MKYTKILLFIGYLGLAFTTSCNSSDKSSNSELITKAETLKVGMKKSQVVSSLGQPSSSVEEIAGEMLIWKGNGENIIIISIDNKGLVADITIPK